MAAGVVLRTAYYVAHLFQLYIVHAEIRSSKLLFFPYFPALQCTTLIPLRYISV